MAHTPESLKRALADGAAEQGRVNDYDKSVREAADRRMTEIDGELDELRPTTLTDPDAAVKYNGLVEERGRCAIVAGQR